MEEKSFASSEKGKVFILLSCATNVVGSSYDLSSFNNLASAIEI
jgi:hypothetical protein